MEIQSRSYGGKLFRPKPEIFQREDGLVIIAIPWGPRRSAQDFIHSISEYFNPQSGKMETTLPFGFLTFLSPIANQMRTALLIANNHIYSEENNREYQSGIEVLLIYPDEQEICLGQIGGPSVFMDRKNSSLIPLISTWDLSTEIYTGGKLLPPLPKSLAGIDSSPQVHMTSMRRGPSDKLILLHRSYYPNNFYTIRQEKRNLEGLSEALSKSDPHCPFWLGVIK